jgi:hypothetical protein
MGRTPNYGRSGPLVASKTKHRHFQRVHVEEAEMSAIHSQVEPGRSVDGAAFPLREDAAGVTYDPGGHIVGGVMFFMTSAVGLIVLSRRIANDARWSRLATYTLVAGIIALAGFVAGGVLVMPDDAPLHQWAGLFQRALILVVLFPCRIVLSLRLRRVARAS